MVLQGFRSAYEPRAIAQESGGVDEAVEARRRVRIISRGWKGLFSHIQVLNPFKVGLFSLQFIARKLLRWLGPLLMILALGSNIALAGRPFYRVILVMQGSFYALALLGAVLNRLKICCCRRRPIIFAD